MAVQISQSLIPLIIAGVAGYALLQHCDLYDIFIRGSRRGLRTSAEILPVLVALLTAVGMLRASGFLDIMALLFKPVTDVLHVAPEIISLITVKLFSSSAANGLLVDIYKKYGTDSISGLAGSYILASTETLAYTLSVYGTAGGIKKTRWIIPGALCASAAGVAASIALALMQ